MTPNGPDLFPEFSTLLKTVRLWAVEPRLDCSLYHLSMLRTPILSNINVIIVEDNPDIRTSLRQYLQRQGAVVVIAADAFEGLKAFKEHRPDLVLSDISLPLWNGFRLLQEIRALETETEIRVPVIAMTAFSNLAGSTRTLAAGFQAHLDKPFTSQELLEAIRSVIKL